MQSFLQRVHNFVANLFVKQFLIAKMLKAKQREFVMESGYSYKTYETGKSTAAAVIVVTDWALQFPQPTPPRVHVSLSTNCMHILYPHTSSTAATATAQHAQQAAAYVSAVCCELPYLPVQLDPSTLPPVLHMVYVLLFGSLMLLRIGHLHTLMTSRMCQQHVLYKS